MKNTMKRILAIIQFLISVNLFLSCSGGGGGSVTPYDYHSPEEVLSFLDEVKLNYPSITALESVGYSTDGRPVRAIVISDNPGTFEGEPAIRLTGGIHGDEKVTVELLIRFIEYLAGNYGRDSAVTDLVNSRYIVIIPVLNPDGLAAGTRYNSNSVDLNRNFTAFSEVETLAMKSFSESNIFHLSVTFHAGAVLVNMPFDYAEESVDAPDENDLVKAYAKSYSSAGTFLDNPDLYQSIYMDQGTINGGNWYVITGSLLDWSYLQTGCLDFTVEVSKRKSPGTEDEVEQVFMYNRDSLMAYIAKAGCGVYGRVTDSSGIPIAGVSVSAAYNDGSGITGDLVTKTDSQGYYHRILLPGNYTLTFVKNGYTSEDSGVTVDDNSAGQENNIVMN